MEIIVPKGGFALSFPGLFERVCNLDKDGNCSDSRIHSTGASITLIINYSIFMI